MKYIIKNGLSICDEGFVIIESKKHFIRNGVVICNAALNHRSWNTTEEKKECLTCILKLNKMSVSPAFKTQIENHLNELATKDELFAVTLKKENKNIDDCITYILNQVQQSGKMGFADEEIYGMAVHYYDEDDIQVGKKVSAKVVVNHSIDAPKPKKEAKQNPVQDQPKEVNKPTKPKVEKQQASLSFEFPE